MTGHDDEPVLTRTEGRVAHIVLNRPRVINALNHAMVLRIDSALAAWRADPQVEAVVITGAGERGLCAGGDIRAVHDDASHGDGSEAAAFWRDEYRLNAIIAAYPKPYVAVMDGIRMGGGVGISAHGHVRSRHREITQCRHAGDNHRLRPGCRWHLPAVARARRARHAPALTGYAGGRGGRRAVRARRPLRSVRALGGVHGGTRAGDAGHGGSRVRNSLPERRTRCATGMDRPLLCGRLRRRNRRSAPLQRDHGRQADRRDHSRQVADLAEGDARGGAPGPRPWPAGGRAGTGVPRLVRDAFVTGPAEGVRAQIIDKDRNPYWSPATLAEVSAQDVERPFAHLADLWAP